MRSRLLITALLATAAALAVLAWRDTTIPTLREVTVPIEGLAEEVTLLQVSDLHGARFGEGQDRLAKLLEGAYFDAVALTGDLQANAGGDTEPVFELVALLQSHTDQLFFVAGNHDSPRLGDELSAMGVRDLSTGASSYPLADALQVVSGANLLAVPDTAAAIVLTHVPFDPGSLGALADRPGPPIIVLAGHTHGGQVRLPLLGALAAPRPLSPYVPSLRPSLSDWLIPDARGLDVRGLYSHDGSFQHVSPGLGTHLIRLRLFNQAEMSIIRLVPASPD